jgi:hypothetical protein
MIHTHFPIAVPIYLDGPLIRFQYKFDPPGTVGRDKKLRYDIIV